MKDTCAAVFLRLGGQDTEMIQIKFFPFGAEDWKFIELSYPSLALRLLTESGERHFSSL